MHGMIPGQVRAALVGLCLAMSAWAGGRGLPAARGQTPASETRGEDRAAVRAALQAFEKAFESRDAKALAAHWTDEGEFENVAGVTLHGREAIEQGFARLFERTTSVRAEVHPDSLRFLSKDSAVEEGQVTVRRDDEQAASRARYTAMLVREGGQWKIARLGETPDDGASLDDLAWLIGQWKSAAGEQAEIITTYRWSPSKKFIHATFTLKEAERSLSGTQVIGVDPATGTIHAWTFEANGGVGESDWTSDGDHWTLAAAGTLPDGRALIETNILRRIDDNTLTWQSIERTLDDAPLADLPPVKVVRVNDAP